jgi:hypothetical protein
MRQPNELIASVPSDSFQTAHPGVDGTLGPAFDSIKNERPEESENQDDQNGGQRAVHPPWTTLGWWPIFF